jgi:hypothetical protein
MPKPPPPAWTISSQSSPKTGASSRGDLVARLFFDHFAPRLTAERQIGAAGPRD